VSQRVLLHLVLHLGLSTVVTAPAWRPGACHAHAHATFMTKESQGPIEDMGDASTDEELYAWTMRREAVASCLIEDIFHLRPNPAKSESPRLALAIFCDTLFIDYDFGWLGRVPCRSVKIAGMVIGIKDYESKRIYTSTAPLSSSLSILIYTRNTSQLTTTQESSNVTIRISLHPSVPRNERIERSKGLIIHPSPHQWRTLGDPSPLLVASAGEGRYTSPSSQSVSVVPTTVISTVRNLTLTVTSIMQIL